MSLTQTPPSLCSTLEGLLQSLNATRSALLEASGHCSLAEDSLSSINSTYTDINHKLSSLQQHCAPLLREKENLIKLESQVSEIRKYYTDASRLSSLFQNDSSELCCSLEELSEAIHRCEECVAFFSAHRDFHSADNHLALYNQFLSKAFSMCHRQSLILIRTLSLSNPSSPFLSSYVSLLVGRPLARRQLLDVVNSYIEKRILVGNFPEMFSEISQSDASATSSLMTSSDMMGAALCAVASQKIEYELSLAQINLSNFIELHSLLNPLFQKISSLIESKFQNFLKNLNSVGSLVQCGRLLLDAINRYKSSQLLSTTLVPALEQIFTYCTQKTLSKADFEISEQIVAIDPQVSGVYPGVLVNSDDVILPRHPVVIASTELISRCSSILKTRDFQFISNYSVYICLSKLKESCDFLRSKYDVINAGLFLLQQIGLVKRFLDSYKNQLITPVQTPLTAQKTGIFKRFSLFESRYNHYSQPEFNAIKSIIAAQNYYCYSVSRVVVEMAFGSLIEEIRGLQSNPSRDDVDVALIFDLFNQNCQSFCHVLSSTSVLIPLYLRDLDEVLDFICQITSSCFDLLNSADVMVTCRFDCKDQKSKFIELLSVYKENVYFFEEAICSQFLNKNLR
ncbi:hypothetical protein RCL1_004454 [Eukaryota sp. TZLM3-RCL]